MDLGSDEEAQYNQERVATMSDVSQDSSLGVIDGLPSSSTPQSPQSPQSPQLFESNSSKKRRHQVVRACMACANAHVKCEDDRPCPRCVSHGLICEEKPRIKTKRSKTVLSRSAPAPNAPNRRRKSSAGSPSIRRKALSKAANDFDNPFHLDAGAPIPAIAMAPGWGMHLQAPNLPLGAFSISSPMMPSLPGYGEPYARMPARFSSDPNLPPMYSPRRSLPNIYDEDPNPDEHSPDQVPTGFFDESNPQQQQPFASVLGVHMNQYHQQYQNPSGSWDDYSSGAALSSDMASSEDVYQQNWVDPALTAQPDFDSGITYLSNPYSTNSGW